ncbi:MAG: 2-oxo acid dehydrogenase subunit E2 [Chloroflexi bacterium]|nr:2-oxo acid dehydrogenase subunit E2 [Chloroflexota bacterium]
MAVEVLIPNAGQTSGEATILRWLKKPGDAVKVGEALLEIETDKAAMEVEAAAAGVLQSVRYEAGAVVPVLTTVAVIATAGESAALPTHVEAREALPRSTPAGPNGGAKTDSRDLLTIMRAHRPNRTLASPLARTLAANAGLELAAVIGSGPRGRIMKRDVQAVSMRPPLPTAEPGSRWSPFSVTRRTIAERMAASWREAPQVTLTTEADAEALAHLRAQFQNDLPDAGDLSYTDLFVKITAAALREQPYLNARVEDEGIRLFDAIHIGLAVDTERGLIVPVIRDADRKGVAQIVRERRDLAERARGGKLRPDELSGGTFTLTNLGAFEIDAFTPIINPPEGAVLGVGRVVKKPVVRDDELRPGMTVALSLTFDHRLVDGGPAARFLQRIKTLVEKPHLLIA